MTDYTTSGLPNGGPLSFLSGMARPVTWSLGDQPSGHTNLAPHGQSVKLSNTRRATAASKNRVPRDPIRAACCNPCTFAAATEATSPTLRIGQREQVRWPSALGSTPDCGCKLYHAQRMFNAREVVTNDLLRHEQ